MALDQSFLATSSMSPASVRHLVVDYPGSQRFSKRRATKCEAVRREKIDKSRLRAVPPFPSSDSVQSAEALVSALGTLSLEGKGGTARALRHLWLIDLTAPRPCLLIGGTLKWQVCRYWLMPIVCFLSPLLSLSCLVSSRRKKTSGTRVAVDANLTSSLNS